MRNNGVERVIKKRFTDDGIEEIENQSFTDNLTGKIYWIDNGLDEIVELLNKLHDENEQLKEGMIGVVDRYIKNVDCNPPSSTRTYMKIKGALLNIREDLRDLIEDLE